MPECICPDEYRDIPSDKRVWLFEPGAGPVKKNGRVVPGPGAHIFHADCPMHGYSVIKETVRE